jgi:mono/diheme cytochrome c family protein
LTDHPGAAEKYDAAMPGFHFLSDCEVADIVSYVRSTFGGKQEAITAADVAKVRHGGTK